ncbi:zinc finger and SCAN domain-containing protein 5A-like isoform X3 [Dermacentor silvarum]|uniref:zinc finger and SCAN domain-containing protein 5A-like isoform X3 n=1 Tax=Dermacentor silvarum TaxID=543639 RepID=UPI0021018101|nr:zinc finger and SCAN domain-containing protein 5A-like isoform X3 [Dermacentor silvarum]
MSFQSWMATPDMAREEKARTTVATTKTTGGQAGPGEDHAQCSSDSGTVDDDTGACDRSEAWRAKHARRRRSDISSRTCGICEKTFSNRSAVRRHLATHTGEKPFSCTVCDRQFSLKGNLVAHSLTHSGAKPFECRLCPWVFSQQGSLKRHLRRKHKGQS